MKFKLSDSFLSKYKSIKPPFGFNGFGEVVYFRCVSVETPVLCGDLSWKPAGELQIGDTLLAFDEELSLESKERYFKYSQVTANSVEDAECFGIELENGETLYATSEHPWLVKTGAGLEWVQTKDLGVGSRGAHKYMIKICEPTTQDYSYESGFLAAAFDSEGSLDRSYGLVFTQIQNELLDTVKTYLGKKGFDYNFSEKNTYNPNSLVKGNFKCFDITLYGKEKLFKFFSEFRPPRLLKKFLNRIQDVALRATKHVKILRVFPAGVRKIAVLSTSSATHITAGYPSHNTYSRVKEDGQNEVWWETVARVVEGTFNMQKRWIDENGLEWNPRKAQQSAHEMYDRIFNMKFLPPGRGLWAMGSPITEDKKLFAALNNCGFCTTANLAEQLSKPFRFLMDASMLGVGVGFDTKGAGSVVIKGDNKVSEESFVVPDTREGWVDAVGGLIDSYFLGSSKLVFDYSLIRPEGVPIKGFGGLSSGHKPLAECIEGIRATLERIVGKDITRTAIVDIMNLIGKAVVAGNVRRTAEIVFDDSMSDEYLDLKNYEVNPHRETFGWTSNNSILCSLGMDYSSAANRTKINGEPGYFWLDNARAYSRMNNGTDNKDFRAVGCNPCVEQTLEDKELCCLVETFPHNHDSIEDFVLTLKYAYLYAKTVTLGKTHWPETNRVLLRNRRIGCSMSGIAQFISNRGINTLKEWCDKGYEAIQRYDIVYSDWLAIPRSIKTTSIKPSGTVSLLAGATPGMHYPEDVFCIRRMRLSKHSDLVPKLRDAGYKIEPCFGSEDNTVVAEFPIQFRGIRKASELSLWEQLSLAAFLQKHWADNQVSCTVTFKPHTRDEKGKIVAKDGEEDEIVHALNYFQYQLKGVSFLPRRTNVYRQMPYEGITEAKYNEILSGLKALRLGRVKNEEAEIEKGCNNDVCLLK